MNETFRGGWLDEFLKRSFPPTQWLIDPLLPVGGVVFLHGPTSVGKSPFTWALAAAVSEGTEFSGYPVLISGPVLYIELDTPANLIQPRLAKLSVKPQFVWLEVMGKAINLLDLAEEDRVKLVGLYNKVQPVLVIINTLRKAFEGDDKDSSVPNRVYDAARELFPGCCIMFVHHDKKTPSGKDTKVDPDQMFSGSMHWANDAQLALHIMRRKEPKGEEDTEYKKTSISVSMTKSQVCDHEAFTPLQMRLEKDGTNWQHSGPAAYRRFYSGQPAHVSHAQRIERVMEQFNIGKSAAYNACRELKE
jgi:RecA-family ATPase